MKKVLITLLVVGLLCVGGYFGYQVYLDYNRTYQRYIGSKEAEVSVYDSSFKEIKKITRGTKITTKLKETVNEDKKYYDVEDNDETYYILEDNIVEKYEDSVYEKEMYVRTSTTVYKDDGGLNILGLVKKGTTLSIIGFSKMVDGNVGVYKINYNETEGYVYAKYLLSSLEEANKAYDAGVNLTREDIYGGGSAITLDYYPYEHPKFSDNVMPDEVRALYINSGAVTNIDAYIDLAKKANINAFVIDIKGNGSATYASPIMNEYSPTTYSKAIISKDDFTSIVKKCHDNGLYVIGRISAFNDIFYATDHPEYSITGRDNQPYLLNSTYWPSAYQRNVWEYNVKLGVEAVSMGVNEIQFDYMRFPDRTWKLQQNGTIDFRNEYDETKAEALQTFAMYACDAIHAVNGYVSADVFGETSNDYVTAYGQYWPALSNIFDVMSAMPYPDHFGPNSYGIAIPWKDPYRLFTSWGKDVMTRQSETTTPAVVRTWIQAYNSIREPYVVYNADMVYKEIKGLHDAGLTGGYMTWNSGSNLDKYSEISSAFTKEE